MMSELPPRVSAGARLAPCCHCFLTESITGRHHEVGEEVGLGRVRSRRVAGVPVFPTLGPRAQMSVEYSAFFLPTSGNAPLARKLC